MTIFNLICLLCLTIQVWKNLSTSRLNWITCSQVRKKAPSLNTVAFLRSSSLTLVWHDTLTFWDQNFPITLTFPLTLMSLAHRSCAISQAAHSSSLLSWVSLRQSFADIKISTLLLKWWIIIVSHTVPMNRQEKSLRHVAVVAKVLDDN